jgi:hypothetical protein
MKMIWRLRILVLSDGFDNLTRLYFLRHVTQEGDHFRLQDHDHTVTHTPSKHTSHFLTTTIRSHLTPSLDQNPRLTQLTQKTSHNNQSNFYHMFQSPTTSPYSLVFSHDLPSLERLPQPLYRLVASNHALHHSAAGHVPSSVIRPFSFLSGFPIR